MTVPRIAIKRHDVSLYEWQVLYGPEMIDGDAGEFCISECVTSGVGAIPDSEPLVEISYRGVHMGTFSMKEIQEYPEKVSERIVESYALLIGQA